MSTENSKYDKNFSERLRKSLGSDTQTTASKRLNCSQALISKYLRGDIPEVILFLASLEKEYSADLNWLITGDDPVVKAIQTLAELDMQQIYNGIADQIDSNIDTPASVDAKLGLVKSIFEIHHAAKGILEQTKAKKEGD